MGGGAPSCRLTHERPVVSCGESVEGCGERGLIIGRGSFGVEKLECATGGRKFVKGSNHVVKVKTWHATTTLALTAQNLP